MTLTFPGATFSRVILLPELIYGKRCGARESMMFVNFSRDFYKSRIFSRKVISRGIFNPKKATTGRDARARELTSFINFSRAPHLFPRINSRSILNLEKVLPEKKKSARETPVMT
jgi:hypothetical protein